jgi:tetratricopeptide (TPR) repeat protein
MYAKFIPPNLGGSLKTFCRRFYFRRLAGTAITAIIICLLLAPSLTKAQEPSIDRLLKKLPPPEKLVKPQVEKQLQKPDPAENDPLAKQVVIAAYGNQPAKALALSRQLANKDPGSLFANVLHGLAAFDAQQWPEASHAFRSAIAVRTDIGVLHLALGASEMVQGHFAAAVPSLRKSGELDSSQAAGWLLASECEARLNHWQESVSLAKRGTAAEPSWVFTWIQLARAQQGAGSPHETLNAMVRAAEISPDNAEIQALVGFGYINLNRLPEAIPHLERAARFAPKDYLVQSQLGFCLQATGQIDEGIKRLRKGASLNSNYGPVWEHLGLAYQKQGHHDDAIKSFEKAAQLMPQSQLPWEHLAQEYRAVGRGADAERATVRARQLTKNAPAKKKG